jgi:2'-5' RNA ligase
VRNGGGGEMRTFIALEVPENIQKEVFSLKENISSHYAKIRWVKKENIHITLAFLGEIVEDVIEQVKERLQLVSKKHQTFTMTLQGVGVFPQMKRPRVLWVGVVPEVKEPITHIANDVIDALGFLHPKDKKKFSPHITFGRIKFISDLSSLQKVIESISFETDEFMVNKITLFKSDLKPDGAIYTPLSKYPLRENK